jgi:cytoskeletal protein RodZ
MRITNLLIKLFLLMALAIGLSGCQKDPVQPMDASAHVTKVSEKKEPEKKPTNSSTKKKIEATNTDESKTTKASTTKKVEKPKVTVSQKPVTKQTATSTKPKTMATSTPTTSTQKKQTVKQKPQAPVATVTVSIVGYENKQLLPPTKVPYSKGEMFLDATLNLLKEKGIQVSVRGTGASAYVEGINNEYEFDHGAKSGWLASKNGLRLTQSAGITSIKAGDRMEWRYTTTGE